MSWGTCYGGSNNIHFGFPPLMSDGRNYATWNPACDINTKLSIIEIVLVQAETAILVFDYNADCAKFGSVGAFGPISDRFGGDVSLGFVLKHCEYQLLT